MTHRIFAIVVAFHPEPGQLERLIAEIKPQVDCVVVICNSPLNASDPAFTSSRVELIRNGANIGLAGAQNAGLQLCARNAADFVMFLDQDSEPPGDLVARLLEAHNGLTDRGEKVAAVGPLLRDAVTADPWPFQISGWFHTRQSLTPDRHGCCEADFLFCSGSLVEMAAFREIGGFMDALFIDHVDLEWCFRAATRGWRCFGVPGIGMVHRVGDKHVRLLGRLHPLHSADRDYFVFRNAVALLRLPHLPVRWKSNEVLRLLPRAIFYSLLHRTALKHLASCLRGMRDGFRMPSLPPAPWIHG